MKKIKSMISIAILAGTVSGSAFAASDGILLKEEAENNYCHMKFPAMRPSTLDTKNPQLKSSTTGDVIDFYGPCDESPTGKDQVLEQRREASSRFDREYEDGSD
jgi:hypothetical protein